MASQRRSGGRARLSSSPGSLSAPRGCGRGGGRGGTARGLKVGTDEREGTEHTINARDYATCAREDGSG
ncbi:hypothetical protein JCM11251_000367 [Rhodosporidiobolus azoricus]